ncbi:uncharacterized protein [Palaemon carinicauda]|uniref:uncharacterized protein n=1 Tax=Palaemon carinicauda TaxID=392227 RepID=UPI0035B5A2DA
MTKVDALMDKYFTPFKTSITASTPDEVDNYSTSNEADVYAEEHLRHLSIVLDSFQQYGLVVWYNKCNYGTNKMSFLVHRITSEGVLPIPEKVVAVQNFPAPSTFKALQEFLGIYNYYHRFRPAFATTLAQIYVSLKGKLKDLKRGPLQEAAFRNAKNSLSTAAVLTFPEPHAPLLFSIDASNIAIGAVPEQGVNSSPHPLVFFCRKLSHVQEGIRLLYLQPRIAGSAFGSPSLLPLFTCTPFVISMDHMLPLHVHTQH